MDALDLTIFLPLGRTGEATNCNLGPTNIVLNTTLKLNTSVPWLGLAKIRHNQTTRNLIYAVIHYVFGIGEGIPSHLNVLLNFKRLRFHWHFLQHPFFHLGELGQAAFYIHGDENGRRTHNYITGMELEKIQRDCTHQ